MSFTLPPIPQEYLDIKFLMDNEKANNLLVNKQILPFAASEIVFAPIKSANYLTNSEDVKCVVQVCLNLQNLEINFDPGQTFGIIPKNNIYEVNQIIARLNLKNDSNKLFEVSIKKDCTKKNAKIPVHVPITGTIYETLLNNVDIRSAPKKLFLRALSNYTSNENELNILNELCSKEGAGKYNDFITNNYITLLELLNTFKSCSPPFSLLLEHLPKLQPRSYSIICSQNPQNELKFIYVLEILPNSLKGVCTGELHENLIPFLNGDVSDVKIPIYLRQQNDFKLPQDLSTNIILIAAGSGIAPFIGFLEKRKNELDNGNKFGDIYLYFGCRYSEKDFLFKTRINNYVELGVIKKLYTSFSRENNTIKFVQDNIKINEKELVKKLKANTIIYVCGNSKMCKDVFETIAKCYGNVENILFEESQKVLKDLKKQKRYIEDIWT